MAAAYESRSPAARFVLVMLALHADTTDWAWPSIPTLAAETGLERRTIIRALHELEHSGQLVAHRRPGKTTRYRLVFATRGDMVSRVTQRHGCHDATVGGDITPRGGDITPPEVVTKSDVEDRAITSSNGNGGVAAPPHGGDAVPDRQANLHGVAHARLLLGNKRNGNGAKNGSAA
jgi:hypothetical protein